MGDNDKIGDKEILQVLLTEYGSLRGELVRVFERELKLFTVIISVLGVIYGITFAYAEARDLILFMPLIILSLGLRFQYENYGIFEIGKYLQKLEEQIKEKMSYEEWTGWQNHWDSNQDKIKILVYDVGSKWLLFIAIPMIVSVLYSWVELFDIMDISKLPQDLHFFHWSSLFIYGFLIVSTFGYFILYKKLYKEEIYKEILNKISGN